MLIGATTLPNQRSNERIMIRFCRFADLEVLLENFVTTSLTHRMTEDRRYFRFSVGLGQLTTTIANIWRVN
jgi:hypothetical protein